LSATRIVIEDLEVAAHVGVTERERESEQPLLLTVSMTIDLDDDAVLRDDSIAGTVDYSTVAREIGRMFAEERFRLIETAALRVSRLCLERSRVRSVDVTVKKPRALPFAACAAVHVTRAR
jgi:dihydroneopterin aldolase